MNAGRPARTTQRCTAIRRHPHYRRASGTVHWLCLGAFLHLCVCSWVASAETIDRVLAVVAGQVIMLTDVIAARDLGLVTPEGADPIRGVLARLIDRELVLAEVERYA